LFIDLLPSRVDLLKLSECYSISRLFWVILSTIGLSDFHTIVLTLLVTYWDGLPAHRRSPVQVVT